MKLITSSPFDVKLSIYAPRETIVKFRNSEVSLESLLRESEQTGVMNSAKIPLYPFRYEIEHSSCTREMYDKLYSKLPIGSVSSSVFRLVGVILSKMYDIPITPSSGRLPTPLDILSLATEKANYRR